MLFMVLALLLLGLYLVRRFSGIKGMKNSRQFIQVLAVHHLSPKEKLVLVKVLEEIILMGVTPSNITRIALLDKDKDLPALTDQDKAGFSQILANTVKRSIFQQGAESRRNLSPGQGRQDG